MGNLRDLIGKKVIKQKILLTEDHSEDLFTLSLGLTVAVKKIFRKIGDVRLSQEPAMEKKPITSFMSRMRIDAMEKFNNPTVFSVVHFYQNKKKQEKNNPVGFLIVYVEKKFIPELLRLLKYPYIDNDDDEAVKDGCGTLCNLIAGYFKNEISRLGYAELEMSHFHSYINSIADGVELLANPTDKYEISYSIEDKKRLVTETVMTPLVRKTV